jgi:short-subunit dehydrogenase
MKALNRKIRDWKSHRVWIVGASSGIGAALVSALRQKGARVALSARSANKLNAFATETDLVLPLDVTDSDSIQTAYAEIEHNWGGIDLIIYCAGYYKPMRAWELEPSEIETTLKINLHGVYNLLNTAVPQLIDQASGGICLIASVAGYTGLPKAVAYGPSKAAMINLAQILYSDLKPKGLDVYLVNPGFVNTRLTKQNDFAMPALITSDEAARSIIAGFEKGNFEIHFPKRFTRFMRLLAILPDRLRFYLLKKAVT